VSAPFSEKTSRFRGQPPKCKPGRVCDGFCRRTNKHKSNECIMCNHPQSCRLLSLYIHLTFSKNPIFTYHQQNPNSNIETRFATNTTTHLHHDSPSFCYNIYYNRLSISRCCEKRTTRLRAAPARKRPSGSATLHSVFQSWCTPVTFQRWAILVRALPEILAPS
jgi:hypothetical protein